MQTDTIMRMKFCPGLPTLADGTEWEEGRLKRRTGSETVSLDARVARLSQAHESGHIIIISILRMSVHVPMIFSLCPTSCVLKAADRTGRRLKVNNPPQVLTAT